MAITNIFRFSLPTKSNPSTLPFDTSFTSSAYFLVSSPHFRSVNIIRCLSTSNSSIDSLRVVLAAGGTGGHVYPAVAIADELKLAYPTAEILFLGTPNSTESAAVPSAGFMHSLHLAYAAADLIVSRAGAMTCSEILATGKPSIQIPSPYEDEGHQFRNASTMADMAGSRVIDEDELDSTTLAIAIQEILGDESKMADMSERALRVSKPNASAEIVQHIGNLINLSTRKGKQQ